MKKEKHIVTTLFLLLLLCGCIKKETELITNNSQVEYTEITEAYLGESKELTIKGDNDLFVKLYIDGQEVAKDVNGNIRYNLSSLALGTHSIKVECYVDDEWFEKSWTCKIVEMPVIFDFPALTCNAVAESYEGESATITASTETDSKITLYIDGTERLSSTTKELSFDVAALALGTHKIKIISVNGDKSDQKEFVCKILEVIEQYDYVDLGLPSGTLWATCNVGAENPWDWGDFFAWGEVKPKDGVYDWTTYKYANADRDNLTKYCNKSDYGYNNFTDNLIVLLPEDDAATINMGKGWRIPTIDEWQELKDNSTIEWTSDYQGTNIAGHIVWDKLTHSTHIFLPAAGVCLKGNRSYEGQDGSGYHGEYWSSTLDTRFPYIARKCYTTSNYWRLDFDGSRQNGLSVRPVRYR